MASKTSRREQKSIPWWVLTMAVALCVAVLAFAMRSSPAVVPSEITADGEAGPSTGLLRGALPGAGAAAGAGRGGAPVSLAAASESVSIEMYSAAWCTACSRAKEWLRAQGVSYHEVDVDQRSGAMAQLQVLNPRRTLPTFDVQGQVLVGFQPDQLETAIRGAAHN